MGFSTKNIEIFSKSLKVANLPKNATEIVKFLKTFKDWVFQKNRWVFRKKILNLFRIAKCSKFAVKGDLNSKPSQNVQILGF